jgi:hypothetical protein
MCVLGGGIGTCYLDVKEKEKKKKTVDWIFEIELRHTHVKGQTISFFSYRAELDWCGVELFCRPIFNSRQVIIISVLHLFLLLLEIG